MQIFLFVTLLFYVFKTNKTRTVMSYRSHKSLAVRCSNKCTFVVYYSAISMVKPAAVFTRFLLLALLAICVLFGVVLLRTLFLQKLPPESDVCSPSEDEFIALDDAALKRFQTALRFRTVSRNLGDYDKEQLRLLNDHIINRECLGCVYIFCI